MGVSGTGNWGEGGGDKKKSRHCAGCSALSGGMEESGYLWAYEILKKPPPSPIITGPLAPCPSPQKEETGRWSAGVLKSLEAERLSFFFSHSPAMVLPRPACP